MQLLASPDEIARRVALLQAPHVAPLSAYAESLRSGSDVVPDFDPEDGGVNATTLFLFEKPGPKAGDRSRGSGFISRDNDDQTARATREFMERAGFQRSQTVIWNAIPWWNGQIDFTEKEKLRGFAQVPSLLHLLPRIHTVVLVGKTAGGARDFVRTLRVVESPHPSPLVRARYPDKWNEIPQIWAQALHSPTGP